MGVYNICIVLQFTLGMSHVIILKYTRVYKFIFKEESFTTKERKKTILKSLMSLSLIVGIVGWLCLSQDVHAANATISNGYLYIPASIGCPKIYALYESVHSIWISGGDDDDGYMSTYSYESIAEANSLGYNPSYGSHMKDTGVRCFYWKGYSSPYGNVTSNHYYIKVSGSPILEGSYIKYAVAGVLETEFGGETAGPHTWGVNMALPGSINVEAKGSHTLTTKVSNATCTSPATYKCSGCNAVVPSGSALGHSWGDWVTAKEATVYEEGTLKHTCARDRSHTETKVIPKKNFQIFAGGSRVQKVYQGNALIMNAASGSETLVK